MKEPSLSAYRYENGITTRWEMKSTKQGKLLHFCRIYGERLVVHHRAGQGLIARYVGRERALNDDEPLRVSLNKALIFALTIARKLSELEGETP